MAVYNVWIPFANRWTNAEYQDPKSPRKMTYAEARKLADGPSCEGCKAEVREIGSDNKPIGGAVLFACEQASASFEVKSDGSFCKGCGNFFPMAVANQPDGTLKCFSCRRGG